MAGSPPPGLRPASTIRYGVPMRIIDGYRRYHPVGLTRLGLKYLSRYRLYARPTVPGSRQEDRGGSAADRCAYAQRDLVPVPIQVRRQPAALVLRIFAGLRALALRSPVGGDRCAAIPCPRRPDVQLPTNAPTRIRSVGNLGRWGSIRLDRRVSPGARPDFQRPRLRVDRSTRLLRAHQAPRSVLRRPAREGPRAAPRGNHHDPCICIDIPQPRGGERLLPRSPRAKPRLTTPSMSCSSAISR